MDANIHTRSTRRKKMIVIKTIVRFLAKFFGLIPWLLFRRQRVYHENKWNKNRPLKGPAIIVSNHTSMMDYLTIMFVFPFRKIRTLIAEVIYKHFFLGVLCNLMDNIPIHRERNDLSFMGEAVKTLRKGKCIQIFPEGRINQSSTLLDFKPSMVYLALRSGAPIVPCYIEPNYSSIKRTRVIIGEKIYLQDYCDEVNPSPEKVRELCELVRNKVAELKRLMGLYRKEHTYSLLDRKMWFLDFAKAFLWLPNKIVFPTKFVYLNGATKKDRNIKGRGIIASKHYWFNDPPIMAVHYMNRRVKTIIAAELQDSAKWLLTHLNTLRFERLNNAMDPRCFMEVINTLRANGVIGIYPEGHLSPTGLGELTEGAAYFSLKTNSPIYFYWMANPWKPFRRNHVIVEKALVPSDYFTLEEMQNKDSISKYFEVFKERITNCHNEAQKYLRKPKKSKK